MANTLEQALYNTDMPPTEDRLYIVVDNNRIITVPNELTKIAVNNDTNAITVTFNCPRVFGNIDLGTLNIYIICTTSSGMFFRIPVVNKIVEESIVNFDWDITSGITAYPGKISFAIEATNAEDVETSTIIWHSEINNSMTVSDSLNDIRTVYAVPGSEISIGKYDENLATEVIFSEPIAWSLKYGDGNAQLIYRRPAESIAYPIMLQKAETGSYIWLVDRTNTEMPGHGKAELRYTVNDTLVKSVDYDILVEKGIGDFGDAPIQPPESYLNQIIEQANRAKSEADRATEQANRGSQLFAPAIPVTMTGTTVSTDIVSPVEHDVKCKVSRINLLEIAQGPYTDNGITYTPHKDVNGNVDYIDIDGKMAANSGSSRFFFGKSHWGSMDVGDELTDVTISTNLSDDPNLTAFWWSGSTGQDAVYKQRPVFTTKFKGKYTVYLQVDSGKQERIYNHFHVYLQVEYGKSASPFTPYISNFTTITVTQNPGGKTFKASSDGAVTGMKSISPSMTILTDNPGVTVEATYNADTKKYIESQDSGTSGTSIDDSAISTDSTWSSRKMVDTFYGYMPVTVSGNYISVDDVSEAVHKVKCKISGVPDLPSVKIRQYGKNMLSPKHFVYYSWFIFGSESVEELPVFLQEGKKYTLSVDKAYNVDTDIDISDASQQTHVVGKILANEYGTSFVMDRPTGMYRIYAWNSSMPSNYYSKWQLIQGEASYSPNITYDMKVFSPSPDGTISDMVSISPDMTIFADNPKVTIEITYKADIKKYIDNQSTQVTDAILSLGGNV